MTTMYNITNSTNNGDSHADYLYTMIFIYIVGITFLLLLILCWCLYNYKNTPHPQI